MCCLIQGLGSATEKAFPSLLPQKIHPDKASLGLERTWWEGGGGGGIRDVIPHPRICFAFGNVVFFFFFPVNFPEFLPSAVSHLCYFRPGACLHKQRGSAVRFSGFSDAISTGFALWFPAGSGEEKQGGFREPRQEFRSGCGNFTRGAAPLAGAA